MGSRLARTENGPLRGVERILQRAHQRIPGCGRFLLLRKMPSSPCWPILLQGIAFAIPLRTRKGPRSPGSEFAPPSASVGAAEGC